MRNALRMAVLVAAGWLSREFVHRGRVHGQLRAHVARQGLLLQQGGVLNAALREQLAGQASGQAERVLEVPLGPVLPDAVRIHLAAFEGYTEDDWVAWQAACVATVRGLVGQRLEHRAAQEVARLEAMARGVGPDAAPAEGQA